MSKERAQAKIDEWFVGVTEQAFRAAVELKLAVGVAEGDYRFRGADDRLQVAEGALRFFREFSSKVIELSDGRCVYFAPDTRARSRGVDNAMAWAEYAIHAVTSSGRRIVGKDYWERLFNPVKLESLDLIEAIIRREDCFATVNDGHPERDCIIFVGASNDGRRLEIVTRLDEFGNVNADLTEVTVVVTRKKGETTNPPSRPLTEVVEAVAQHQAAGFSPSTVADSIAQGDDGSKCASVKG